MAPLVGVILVDYFVARKGNIHVPSCYNSDKSGLYWFNCLGTNWYGVTAWLLGTTMGLPGLVGQYQPDIISNAAKYMYMMGWLLTFTTAAVVYYVLTLFAKRQVFPVGKEGAPLQWEWLANEGRDGFFEGERDDEVLFAPATPPIKEAEEFPVGEKSWKSPA